MRSLKCIPDLTGMLRTIESFYDHTEKIFQTFCDESDFLPDKFRDSKWHSFFKYFGLKTVPTCEEFVMFCKHLPSLGNVSDITTGSEVLLSIVFDVSDSGVNKYKYIHSPQCLQEVSKIHIAIVQTMSELNCIKEQKMGEINVSSSITLTKPCGSSQVSNAYLVWTILPLIKLPLIKLPRNETSHECLHERLKYQGIVLSPSVKDVISNLRNLSTSIFANYDRFEKSSVASNSSLLPTIEVKMMEYLQMEL